MNVNCTYNALVEINRVVPNPRNPNKHTDQQITLLAKIIKYQGWRNPIVVSNKSGFVVSGHGRLEAAIKNEWTQVPVDFQDFENDAQEYAHMIADNKIAELAEHDDQMMFNTLKEVEVEDFDYLGIPDFEMPKEIEEGKNETEDNVPTDVDTRVNSGDLWILGEHRLLCGDSISDWEKLFNGIKPELCFTSPPYSDQRDYSGDLQLSPKHLAKFMIAPCNLFAINLGLQRKDNQIVQYWDDYISVAKDMGHKFLSWNIWDRGSAFSIGQQTAMFPIEHEWILIFGQKKQLNKTIKNKNAGRKKGATNRQKDGSLKMKDTYNIHDKRHLGTIIRNDVDRELSVDHPAKFPVLLPEKYIEACTNVNENIYDPFGGSGSTLIACEKTDRKCFMMEIDPHYCDIILKRWEDYSCNKAHLDETKDQV